MDDGQKPTDEPRLLRELRAAGIPDQTLKTAAGAARRFCAGSRPLEGGTLDPRSGIEYQQLIASLARKASQ